MDSSCCGSGSRHILGQAQAFGCWTNMAEGAWPIRSLGWGGAQGKARQETPPLRFLFLLSHSLTCASLLSRFPAPPTLPPLRVRSESRRPLQSLGANSSESRVVPRQRESGKSLGGCPLLLPLLHTSPPTLAIFFLSKFYFAAVADWVQRIVFKKGSPPSAFCRTPS